MAQHFRNVYATLVIKSLNLNISTSIRISLYNGQWYVWIGQPILVLYMMDSHSKLMVIGSL